MFHLVPKKRVNDLTIERVKVRAPFDAPNTDAIDVGPGTNCWIHDCDIDTGDDDIVIKSGGTNILIENNTLTAEKDFDIRDAEKPVFERVTRTIKPGVAPAINPGEH